jgi:hypothetical protein
MLLILICLVYIKFNKNIKYKIIKFQFILK